MKPPERRPPTREGVARLEPVVAALGIPQDDAATLHAGIEYLLQSAPCSHDYVVLLRAHNVLFEACDCPPEDW